MITRKKTRQITVGSIPIGGRAPVVIQSMTNTATTDVDGTVYQIEKLVQAGCQIVRVAIPDQKAVEAFKLIRAAVKSPLVADIHFQYRFALAAIEAGADKVRINPGNIGSKKRVREVVDAAKQAGIPLRIGVNAGSLEKDLLEKYTHPTPQALAESAMRYVSMMESFGYEDFILSIKASDVLTTIEACKLLATQCDYPQHIGITEAGTVRSGAIRSAVGIGALLFEGIGDTIRVSLSGDPVEEIYVAKEILKSLALAQGPVVIACPTCGRTNIGVAELAQKVEESVSGLTVPIKIAVMGCIVNGPGEAREADIGVAGGKGTGVIFQQGKEIEKVEEREIIPRLLYHIENITDGKSR